MKTSLLIKTKWLMKETRSNFQKKKETRSILNYRSFF